jgi:hypothetical protein
MKVSKTITVPFILYGCETGRLSLVLLLIPVPDFMNPLVFLVLLPPPHVP